jgi:putative endonuclease
MFTVYVLQSIHFDKIYIGYTSNLENRVMSHNHSQNKGWTRSFMPWRVVYTEIFESKQDAMSREKELKSFRGRTFIRNEILKEQ